METNSYEKKIGVYNSISLIQKEISEIGVKKDSKTNSPNQSFNFNFRSIDSVMNALSPLLAKHNLCVLPRVIEKTTTERITGKDRVLFFTVVKVEYDFISSYDGTKHTISVYGEGMDSGDKSTNKAMSSAFKYALIQSFCIPTQEMVDPDYDIHDIKHKTEFKQEIVDNQKELSDSNFNDYLILIQEANNIEDLIKIYSSASSLASKNQIQILKDCATNRKLIIQKRYPV